MFPQPAGSTYYSGYRTIMAYRKYGHYYKENYYSNPDVILPNTTTATGVPGESNNARLITANR